jgi:hypothetical protein
MKETEVNDFFWLRFKIIHIRVDDILKATTLVRDRAVKRKLDKPINEFQRVKGNCIIIETYWSVKA